jgi:hypothetical protein
MERGGGGCRASRHGEGGKGPWMPSKRGSGIGYGMLAVHTIDFELLGRLLGFGFE